MGGIFICPRNPGESVDEVEEKYKRSLQVFDRKGLTLDRRLPRSSFVAYRFRKCIGDDSRRHFLDRQDGDFVLTSGTMIYNEKVGGSALADLFEDFCEGKRIDRKLLGNYCVVICRNNQLWVFNDYLSYYPVYIDSTGTVISNSYLAVARTKPENQINIQEFFEFLLHGFFVDEKTILSHVYSIDSRKMWQIYPKKLGLSRDANFMHFTQSDSFDDVVRNMEQSLCAYFETLGHAFGGKVGSALSGGYDTRLMLALIRKMGLDAYLHVYGDDDASDVVVAKTIAGGEGISLEHVDKSVFPDQDPDEFSSGMESRLYFFDGLNPLGIIDDGRDIGTRLDRAKQASLQLNGAGGEIYREVWNLSDGRVDIDKFIRARFDRGAYPFCRSSFDRYNYFSSFGDKVKGKLEIDRSYLERNEAELMFALVRNVFAANNNSSNNQVSYALLPFMEAQFVFPSATIPIKYKYYGQLQAALINSIDPDLAKYNSSYGIDFSSPVPTSYKLKCVLERHVPLPVRLFKRKMADRHQQVWPYLLSERYLGRIVDLNNLQVSEFIDISKIRDAEIFTRALSIELLLDATRH